MKTTSQQIKFETIEAFQTFCSTNKVKPIVMVQSKKHSNMRGEFFHNIYGEILMNGLNFVYKVKEKLVLKQRLLKPEGCYLSEIWN